MLNPTGENIAQIIIKAQLGISIDGRLMRRTFSATTLRFQHMYVQLRLPEERSHWSNQPSYPYFAQNNGYLSRNQAHERDGFLKKVLHTTENIYKGRSIDVHIPLCFNRIVSNTTIPITSQPKWPINH